MRKTIAATLRTLLLFLASGMFLSSCEKDEPKRSSEASITSLTLTVEDTDYAITFTGKEGKIKVPYATELPATATVKAVVLSAKATGIKVGDKITLPASGTVTLTVTAEDDKTTGVYTITVEKEADIVTVSATETAKRKPTDVRDSYGIFTLKTTTTTGTVTDYHLAVKEKDATAPTADEMKESALKRNISTDAIHVLIAQRLNAPMVDFAEKYFANPTDTSTQTLGTDMVGSYDTDKPGSTAYDGTATGSAAWVKESVLKPETTYVLYGMSDGGSSVTSLLNFSTDATAAWGSTGTADGDAGYIDSTLEEGYIDIAVNKSELYIFPIHHDTGTGSDITIYQIVFSKRTANNLFINSESQTKVVEFPLGYNNFIWMSRDIGTASMIDPADGLQAYILIDTSDYKTDLNYGSTFTLSSFPPPPAQNYSTLSPQQ